MFRKEALDRLGSVEELDEMMHVTTPRSWLVLLALGGLLVAALAWAFFTVIPDTVSGRGALNADATNADNLGATLYVSIDDASEVEPGMSVRLALSSAKQEEYGLLLGTVTATDELPASQQEMLTVVNNDSFVQSLANAGLLVPVHITLTPDAGTPTGYAWSQPPGPPTALHGGMVFNGTVTINEQRAIDMVLR